MDARVKRGKARRGDKKGWKTFCVSAHRAKRIKDIQSRRGEKKAIRGERLYQRFLYRLIHKIFTAAHPAPSFSTDGIYDGFLPSVLVREKMRERQRVTRTDVPSDGRADDDRTAVAAIFPCILTDAEIGGRKIGDLTFQGHHMSVKWSPAAVRSVVSGSGGR